jgi:hypothetical protein
VPRRTDDGGVGPQRPAALVDCGSKFGLLQSQVLIGSDSPAAADPEPELWQKEHRRLAKEQWRHRERECEEAAVWAEEEEMMRRREQQAPSNTGEKRKSNFIDPDDMVEEKVELSFENVVVTPPPKKKKKSLL